MTTATVTTGRVITFYSFKGGVGRTMAVANVAWVLASAGRNVLVVDWDLESPGLHRYLHPFLVDKNLDSTDGVVDMVRGYLLEAQKEPAADRDELRRSFADVRSRVERLKWEQPGWGHIDFLGPGRQHKGYEDAVASMPWTSFFENYDGRQFVAEMRASMLAAGYDYILIDSRTGLSDNAGTCTKLLPDTVVVGFTMSTQAIQGSAEVAYDIEDGEDVDRTVRVLPVPMRVEDAEHGKLNVSRAVARREFAGLPRGMDDRQRQAYWGGVEIPYKAFYAYEEVPAAFGDPSGIADSLLSAYERLTAAISDGEVTAFSGLTEPERLNVLKRFERLLPPRSLSATVIAAPWGRMWAEWISTELGRTGVQVRRISADSPGLASIPDDDTVVAVITDDLFGPFGSAQRTALDTTIRGRFAPTTERVADMLAVRVGHGATLPDPFSAVDYLDLTAMGEQDARTRLLERFDRTHSLPVRPSQQGSAGTRFPIRMPAFRRFRSANTRFVGRTTYLDRLRDHFRWGAGTVPAAVLCSRPGVGKTQIALEFIHRFAADYDTIWWIRAGDQSEARGDLKQLAASFPPEDQESWSSAADSVVTMLEALHRGDVGGRWLLVYHKAVNPAALGPLLVDPSPYGHILVTTSCDSISAGSALVIPVEGFSTDESLALLATWLPVDPAMNDLVDKLYHLPELVNRAGAWMAEAGLPAKDATKEYTREFDGMLESVVSSRGPDELDDETAPQIVASWALSVKKLGKTSAASLRLLEMCAFLAPAPHGVSMDLLTSRAMLDLLAGLDDEIRRTGFSSHLFGHLHRAELVRVDHSNRMIVIPKIAQDILQAWMRIEGNTEERRAEVLQVLAAYAPTGESGTATGEEDRFVELQRHLAASGAVESKDDAVRRWLVAQASFLHRRREWRQVLNLGAPLLVRWQQQADDGEQDFLRLWLAIYVAEAYRALAQEEEAAALDERTYQLQVATLGPRHRHTLRTARSRGADLRRSGRLQEALANDKATHKTCAQELGEDDRGTLVAGHNLAYCMFLAGNPKGALERAWDTYQKHIRILGEQHPETWETALNLGFLYAHLGELDQSADILRKAVAFYKEKKRPTDQAFADRLLAATHRLGGDYSYARRYHSLALDVYRESLGVDHVETMACVMSLAIDNHLLDDRAEAQRLGGIALAQYKRRFSGADGHTHPFIYLCNANVSIFIRPDDPGRAQKLSAAALDGLRSDTQVGPNHFFTLAVAVNHANNLVAAGDAATARDLDELTYEAFVRFYSAAYPYTKIAEANLDDSRRRVADVEGGANPRGDRTESPTASARRDIPIEIPLP